MSDSALASAAYRQIGVRIFVKRGNEDYKPLIFGRVRAAPRLYKSEDSARNMLKRCACWHLGTYKFIPVYERIEE